MRSGAYAFWEGGITMKRLTPLLIAVATLAGVVAFTARAPRHAAAQEAAPIFVTEIPSGYRDWSLISVAHEEGDLRSFAAVLGNDVAITAYRERKLLFPDGTIIAALHYRHVPSEENNKVRRDRRVGVRSLPRRQTFNRRGDDENLLRLPPADESSRPCLYALRTIKQKCALAAWSMASSKTTSEAGAAY